MNPHLMIALALCTTVAGASLPTAAANGICATSPIDPSPIGPISVPPPASPFMGTFCVDPTPAPGNPCSATDKDFSAQDCAFNKANWAIGQVPPVPPVSLQDVQNAVNDGITKANHQVDDAKGEVGTAETIVNTEEYFVIKTEQEKVATALDEVHHLNDLAGQIACQQTHSCTGGLLPLP